MDGIVKYDGNWKKNVVTITFEDQKTTVDKIIENLRKEGFSVDGKPVLSE
jgi:hypothetical protein